MKPLMFTALALVTAGLSAVFADEAVAELVDEKHQECPDDQELRDLTCRARRLIEAEDYLRAYVALQRIDELRRFGGRCLRDLPGYGDWMDVLRRLSETVAAHLDVKAVEQQEGYFLYHNPGKAEPWAELLQSVQEQRKHTRGLVLRVFLEDPSQKEVIQLCGERGCQMLRLPAMHRSRYSQIANGELAVVERLGREDGCFRIGTLRHTSPQIEVSFGEGPMIVLGDIVLLRPGREGMGRLELFLDTQQMNKADIGGTPRNRFLLGPITAGGLYGTAISLPENTSYDAGSFAPGLMWIVWGHRPAKRWQVDLSAGKTTRVQMQLTPTDELGEIITTERDASAAAIGNCEAPLPTSGQPSVSSQSVQEKE